MERLFTKIFYKKQYEKYKDTYKKMDREGLDFEHAILRTHLFYFQGIGLLITILAVPLGILMSLDLLAFKISGYLLPSNDICSYSNNV